MKTIGFFPGCSLHGTALEYEMSLHLVARKFDIELKEINDWNCCGATAAHSLNKLLSVSLPARVLALAEQQGFNEFMVPCAACYSRMIFAWDEINHDPELKKKVSDIIELPLEGKAKPVTILDFINDNIADKLPEKLKKPFTKSVACYYGCLLVRPPKITKYARYEDPMQMENILEKIGANPIDWAYKTECCGAGLSVAMTNIVARLSGKIVSDAERRKAEVIVVACPMCQSNLDMRRGPINDLLHSDYKIPVYYITQAIGLSLGFTPKELGINKHFVKTDSVFFESMANTVKEEV